MARRPAFACPRWLPGLPCVVNDGDIARTDTLACRTCGNRAPPELTRRFLKRGEDRGLCHGPRATQTATRPV